jgi:small subunit ribosomal protein S4
MARYTGPVCRLCRRVGEKLFLKGDRCFTPKCAVERRSNPPGQHTQRRRRQSEHALQLKEKQKARFTYGVLEAQFRRYFSDASRTPGITGELLLQLLELRLDNVVYRLGFGESRKQARQLIRHGHITVNGRKLDIPSYSVKPGDVIAWKGSSTDKAPFRVAKERTGGVPAPTWLVVDGNTMTGRVLNLPNRTDIDIRLNEQAIVEFYSR